MKTQITERFSARFCIVCLVVFHMFAAQVHAQDEPGVVARTIRPSEVTSGSITPVVTENGMISVSVDGLGTNDPSGIIQVEKPAAATVRSAFMAAASTGNSNRILADGDVKIDGTDVNWSMSIPSTISSSNHWADVTSIVKPKIDAALPGRVDFTITEVNTSGIDGEILAVIFDDPSQITDNTVVLLFGAQNVAGDVFAIGLANPLDLSDSNLILDMGLGISFGAQGCSAGQFSQVDVNGIRLTTSAGGEDDGTCTNGALLTAGGLDDSNANPSPLAMPAGNPRIDDELYDLKPFVSTGDVLITVETLNPSNDDNILFASLFLNVTAVVGEGIVLAPPTATNSIGTQHTVTATVQDNLGNPVVGRDVTFTIVSGPHAGMMGTDPTDANGKATFTYTGTSPGTDVILASFVNTAGNVILSNRVTKDWTDGGGMCDVEITLPEDGSIVCDDPATVNGVTTISGGIPPFTITCTVNGVAASVSGNTFTVTVPLVSRDNVLIASCTVVDSLGNRAVCADTIKVFLDDKPPICTFTSSGSSVVGEFFDARSGIASVVPLELVNGTLTVDNFNAGDKRVDFRIDAIDPNKSIRFNIEITDVCGNSSICDPVFLYLTTEWDTRQYELTFPILDRYFQVINHGLSEIRVNLNGNRFKFFSDPTRASREVNAFAMPVEGAITIDLLPYLREGENTMVIVFAGGAGAGANLLLLDETQVVDFLLALQTIPVEFHLAQNYPNPFNPSTTIRFDVPERITEGTRVQLRIYNILGEAVRTLVDEQRFPGQYIAQWDGRNDGGEYVAAGIYIYRLQAGSFTRSMRMILIK